MRVDGTCNRALDRLLREHIDCFEKLEVLLLVRRQRDIFWTAEKVADQLGISRRSALETLEALHASNFLSTIDSAPQVIPVSARGRRRRQDHRPARSQLRAQSDRDHQKHCAEFHRAYPKLRHPDLLGIVSHPKGP